MKVNRIALKKYCDTSGEGAKLYGGRWNLPGIPALYGSSSVSASLLERFTIDTELFSAERYIFYAVMEFDIPDKWLHIPGEHELPLEWDAIPPTVRSQQYGTKLLKSGMLCFGVPSVVDQSSLNFVINPLSKKFDAINYKTYPLHLDQRVVR
ncbi:RES domain-containing protein [Cyclobacterium lianum]|uniref:RES domain-containing protein n=1 Tax=Cyclobacterium lianum TaxID=388280 RepID=A0A1M7N5X2_9BACT|nr:RES family NAD+ phosphorylase [Cyclobacterium lianum]SHM98966.1 RES domain-containing protein [Cyclobacterium lianum]